MEVMGYSAVSCSVGRSSPTAQGGSGGALEARFRSAPCSDLIPLAAAMVGKVVPQDASLAEPCTPLFTQLYLLHHLLAYRAVAVRVTRLAATTWAKAA